MSGAETLTEGERRHLGQYAAGLHLVLLIRDVERILAARLAAVELLADEWDRDQNPHAAWLPIDFAAAVRDALSPKVSRPVPR